MAEGDIELVRAGYAALAERGVDGLLEFAHPEFEMTTPPGISAEPDTYRGHDGIRRYFDSFYEVMDDIRVEPVRFHDIDGKVVVEFNLIATGKTTGVEATQPAVQIWELKDGLAYRSTFFATLDEARADLGG